MRRTGFWLRGYGCPRGKEYGHKELTAPTRTLTSIVRIEGAIHPCCPVKTSGEIPKRLIIQAMNLLKSPPQRSGGRSGGGSGYLRNGCGLDYHKEYVDSQGAQLQGPGTRRFRGLCYADCSSLAGGGGHEGQRSRLHVKPQHPRNTFRGGPELKTAGGSEFHWLAGFGWGKTPCT